VWARLGILALLEQIGEGFVHKRLKLPAFRLRKRPNGRQDFRIDLRGEFSRIGGMSHLV